MGRRSSKPAASRSSMAGPAIRRRCSMWPMAIRWLVCTARWPAWRRSTGVSRPWTTTPAWSTWARSSACSNSRPMRSSRSRPSPMRWRATATATRCRRCAWQRAAPPVPPVRPGSRYRSKPRRSGRRWPACWASQAQAHTKAKASQANVALPLCLIPTGGGRLRPALGRTQANVALPLCLIPTGDGRRRPALGHSTLGLQAVAWRRVGVGAGRHRDHPLHEACWVVEKTIFIGDDAQPGATCQQLAGLQQKIGP